MNKNENLKGHTQPIAETHSPIQMGYSYNVSKNGLRFFSEAMFPEDNEITFIYFSYKNIFNLGAPYTQINEPGYSRSSDTQKSPNFIEYVKVRRTDSFQRTIRSV